MKPFAVAELSPAPPLSRKGPNTGLQGSRNLEAQEALLRRLQVWESEGFTTRRIHSKENVRL